MKRLIEILILGLALVFLSTLSTDAQLIELRSAPADQYLSGGSSGQGRGVGFLANSSFSLSEIAISGDIITQAYTVDIYASPDGNTAGALLASFSASTGSTGTVGWYGIPVSYTFTAGAYYVVNWRSNDGSSFANHGVHPPGPFSSGIEYYWPYSFPYSILPGGEVSLIQGFSGHPPSNGNPLMPVFRFNTSLVAAGPEIPTVSEWGLMAFILMLSSIGLVAVVRRKEKEAIA